MGNSCEEHKINISGQTVYIQSSENMVGVESESVDFVITSPPYWNLKDYGDSKQIGMSTYEEYLIRLDAVWAECYRVARPGAVMVINVNSRRHMKKFYPIPFDIAGRMEGWEFWDHVIWNIPNALPQPNHYMERLLDNKFESCLVFIKGSADEYKFHKPRVPQKYASADPRTHKKNPKGRCLGNIIRIPAYRPPNVKEMGYHVAAYPEELVAFFAECYTDPGDVLLDPFLGSGTTLKVSRVMGRVGIGFELNHDFKPLIEARIKENWATPDWRNHDLLHAASMETGINKPRKTQFRQKSIKESLKSANLELISGAGEAVVDLRLSNYDETETIASPAGVPPVI
jgi:DNA modification methylase